jgi:hypothetical protein
LLTAELVIADLSGLNPNAFYEIGIRHMAQKPIIHMQLDGDKIPFDVSLYRAIKFSRVRPKDVRAARDLLKAQVAATLDVNYQVENPVTNARGRVQLEQHATPEQKVLLDNLRSLRERVTILEGRGSENALAGVISHHYSVTIWIETEHAEQTRSLISDILSVAPGMVEKRSADELHLRFASTTKGAERIQDRLLGLKGIKAVSSPVLD